MRQACASSAHVIKCYGAALQSRSRKNQIRARSRCPVSMEQRSFKSTMRQIAVVGQGTWYDHSVDRTSTIAALRRGLDLGMNHVDTAEMYGDGVAEEIVGQAIAGRGSHPLEETFAAFEHLQQQGKIVSGGVSNFDVSDLEEAWEVAGEGQLVCNQVLYHLEERAIEHAVVPCCEQHDVAVVAYSPFGHRHFPARDRRAGACCNTSPRRTMRRRTRLRCAFCCCGPACLQFPRHPLRSTQKKTPAPEISA